MPTMTNPHEAKWRVQGYVGRKREAFTFTTPEGAGMWTTKLLLRPDITWVTIIPPKKEKGA